MKTHSITIAGLEQSNDEVCIVVKPLPFLQSLPGQFFQVFAADSDKLLPVILHPCRISTAELVLCGSIPKSWAPGTTLHLRGPRGNGFHIPPLTRRAALTTMDQLSPNRLMALADQALSDRVEVTLFTNLKLSNLAPEIEVLPLEELNQVAGWADYFGAALPHNQLNLLRNQLQLPAIRKTPLTAEIMLEVPMICDENSACGVCAVSTSRGWRLACKDGPVFNLDDLLTEERTRE